MPSLLFGDDQEKSLLGIPGATVIHSRKPGSTAVAGSHSALAANYNAIMNEIKRAKAIREGRSFQSPESHVLNRFVVTNQLQNAANVARAKR